MTFLARVQGSGVRVRKQRGQIMAGTIRVALTGAGGQVAYAGLLRLVTGVVFGPDNKVVLDLLDIPRKPDWQPHSPTSRQPLDVAEGNAMDLLDCGFATLK